MAFIFVKDIPTLNTTTKWIGLGSMVIGIVPMAYYFLQKAPYFTPAPREDREAVLQEFEQNL
jgi:hypothetical protein